MSCHQARQKNLGLIKKLTEIEVPVSDKEL